METKKKELVLTFATPEGAELNITVKKPHADLTPQTIKTAMQSAVATTAIGEITQADTIVGAKYVIQQEDTVELPK